MRLVIAALALGLAIVPSASAECAPEACLAATYDYAVEVQTIAWNYGVAASGAGWNHGVAAVGAGWNGAVCAVGAALTYPFAVVGCAATGGHGGLRAFLALAGDESAAATGAADEATAATAALFVVLLP